MALDDRPATSGDLVTAITHDLRQPLTAVEMNVSAAIVFLERASPQVREAIDALNDALDQQRRVRDALHVLQHLAAQPELRREALDLGQVAREVLAAVSRDSMAHGVPVELRFEGPPPVISGDIVLVRQAFVNVVRDAIHASAAADRTPSRRPVRMLIKATEPDTGTAEVHVMHAGAGRGNRGTSLTLALARSVVAAHGATVTVEGEPHRGDAVVIRWPILAQPTSSPELLSDG